MFKGRVAKMLLDWVTYRNDRFVRQQGLQANPAAFTGFRWTNKPAKFCALWELMGGLLSDMTGTHSAVTRFPLAVFSHAETGNGVGSKHLTFVSDCALAARCLVAT